MDNTDAHSMISSLADVYAVQTKTIMEDGIEKKSELEKLQIRLDVCV